MCIRDRVAILAPLVCAEPCLAMRPSVVLTWGVLLRAGTAADATDDSPARRWAAAPDANAAA
eukprot:1284411-Rhodomonas_salina.2